MTEQTMLTFETTRGRYTHVPERNLIEQMRKADAKTRRDLRRGHPLVHNTPAPVMGSPTRTDNLLGRTLAWLNHRLKYEDVVVAHLFRPGPRDRQCRSFNQEIEALARSGATGGRLKVAYVDPQEWGFVQKSS